MALGRDIDFTENYHVFLSSGPAVGMADTQVEGYGLLQLSTGFNLIGLKVHFLIFNLVQRLW